MVNLITTPFKKKIASKGIQFRFSCPKTSQQNGKSKRIRTINNRIRTILFQAYPPPLFWVKSLYMVTHFLKFLPSSAISDDVSQTHLFGTKPDYTLLRVFGCLCYPHVYVNHKLESRATPSIFLGYPSNYHGYWCLDLIQIKLYSQHSLPLMNRFPIWIDDFHLTSLIHFFGHSQFNEHHPSYIRGQ